MFYKLLLLLLLPLALPAQSRKKEYSLYQELGLTGNKTVWGLHYTWQSQVAKTWYLGGGIEGLRTLIQEKEGPSRNEWVVPVMFRLSHVTRLRGRRWVPYLDAGVVLTQPTGTVLDGGLALATGQWQLSAAYRWYQTSKEWPSIESGVYLRFSRLFSKPATKPRFK